MKTRAIEDVYIILLQGSGDTAERKQKDYRSQTSRNIAEKEGFLDTAWPSH